MKRKIFICSLIFLAYAASGYPQTELRRVMTLDDPVRNTIVRSLDNTDFISYVETSGQHLFVKSEIAADMMLLESIPTQYFILDFEVYKRIVFFCGIDVNNNNGIVGYFYIDSVCNDAKNLYIYENFVIDTSNNQNSLARIFTDLEIIDWRSIQGTDSAYVALVGEADNSNTFIMEIIGSCSDPNSWRYAVGFNPADLRKEFEQVSVTDHYVVTGGGASNFFNGLVLRVFDRFASPDIFSGSAYSDNIYMYLTNTTDTLTAKTYPHDHFEMTALQNSDKVATASFWRYAHNPPSALYNGTMLNIYDIPQTINSPNIHSWLTLYDSMPRSIYLSHISDLREDYQNGKILLLLTADDPIIGTECTCNVIPYTTGIPMFPFYYYVQNVEFNRVVLFDNNNAYLTSGYKFSTNTLWLYKYPAGAVTPACSDHSLHYANDLKEFTSKEEYYKLTIYRNTFSFNTNGFASCKEKEIYTDCQN